MIVTAMSDGTPRRTVDLQPQNRSCVRQTHHVQSHFQLTGQFAQNTKKTVIDAWNGYHSVPIREEDRHLTTFITPCGRYRYKVAAQGFLARGMPITRDLIQSLQTSDTRLNVSMTPACGLIRLKVHFFKRVNGLADLCAKNYITLNPKKCQFTHTEKSFLIFTNI